jgi:hypothetical protein
VTAAGRALRALVTAVAAATVVTLPGAPAPAAGCSPTHGVTVVVDFNQPGHPDRRVCDPAGGGRSAERLFEDHGFALTDVQRQPGFVCRVSGLPADDPCVNTPPASAYWSLWWSDGSKPSWSYAALGVDSLQIPDGGSVALVWDQVEGDVQPAVAPGGGTTAAAGSEQVSDDAPPAAEGADNGMPAWVGPLAIGLLLAAAAGTAVVRRRRGRLAP